MRNFTIGCLSSVEQIEAVNLKTEAIGAKKRLESEHKANYV